MLRYVFTTLAVGYFLASQFGKAVEHQIAVVLAVPAQGDGLALKRRDPLGRFHGDLFDLAGGIDELPFLRLIGCLRRRCRTRGRQPPREPYASNT